MAAMSSASAFAAGPWSPVRTFCLTGGHGQGHATASLNRWAVARAPSLRKMIRSQKSPSTHATTTVCRSGSSDSSGAARSSTCQVTEMIILLRVEEEATEEEAEEIVNELWSLQYEVPGCVCGAGGAVVSQQIPAAGAAKYGTAPEAAWTHVVHLRLGSLAAYQKFASHPTVMSKLRDTRARCSMLDQMVWTGPVTNELSCIFRQGDGWDEGFEHILLIRDNEGYTGSVEDDIDAMLCQLSEIAESSRAGAVQCLQGRVQKGAADIAPYVLMARFEQIDLLDAFTSCAPYQAVWEASPRLPGQALMSVSFCISPSADTQSSAGFTSEYI